MVNFYRLRRKAWINFSIHSCTLNTDTVAILAQVMTGLPNIQNAVFS